MSDPLRWFLDYNVCYTVVNTRYIRRLAVKNFLMSKKLMAIFTISILAAMTVPLAFGASSDPTPTAPAQCGAGPWTLQMNIKMTVKNDEDTGFVGYWALDTYVKSVYVWDSPISAHSGAYAWCSLEQYSGTFQTFAGALSPENGVTEPSNGGGTMLGMILYTFNTNATGSPSTAFLAFTTGAKKHLTGNIGTYNFGGTQSDILLGTYATQKGDTSYTNLYSFYFSNVGSITFNTLQWSFAYRVGSGQGYGTMWINGDYYSNPTFSSVGDIIT